MSGAVKKALQHVRGAMIANKHGAPVAPALEAAEEALLRLLFSEEDVVEYLQSSGAQVYRGATGQESGAPCCYCDKGFRRVDGIHIGSQSRGMIPNTPCGRVLALSVDDESAALPWLAHVDGEPLRKQSGYARRFGSARAAYAAACKAAPKKWHP